jgi:hypothetical protein
MIDFKLLDVSHLPIKPNYCLENPKIEFICVNTQSKNIRSKLALGEIFASTLNRI